MKGSLLDDACQAAVSNALTADVQDTPRRNPPASPPSRNKVPRGQKAQKGQGDTRRGHAKERQA